MLRRLEQIQNCRIQWWSTPSNVHIKDLKKGGDAPSRDTIH